MSYRAGAPGFRTVGPDFGDGARAYATAGLGQLATPAQQKKYWDAMAQACTQMADEGQCLSRVARHVPVTIEPGFAGLGLLTSTVTGEALGHDLRRHPSGSTVSVGAHWVKRAINALNSFDGSHTRIHVNGPIAPATMAALRAAVARIMPPGTPASDLAVANDPAGHRSTQRATISVAAETALARLTRVVDPPRPARTTHRTTSTPAVSAATGSPTASASSGKVPGAPDAPPTDTTAVVGTAPDGTQVIVDEGDTTPDWLMPALVVGGLAVAGSVGIVMWGRSRAKAPTKNSRRRKRKNKRRK